jgi:hypothetical protein
MIDKKSLSERDFCTKFITRNKQNDNVLTLLDKASMLNHKNETIKK